jgi:hypothetical protein
MFRSLFRSLIVSRTNTQTRTPVQSFRPQLETLEGRLAPSGWGHHSPSVDVDISHSTIVVANAQIIDSGDHNEINQIVLVGNEFNFGGHHR